MRCVDVIYVDNVRTVANFTTVNKLFKNLNTIKTVADGSFPLSLFLNHDIDPALKSVNVFVS